TGLVLWTVKRRQKLADPSRPHFGFRLVERLNIASIGGLSVAMTAFLWGNRLLPVQLPDRSAWEINLFFIVWAAMLFYACARPARKAWVEVLSLAAILLALTPVLNAITTDRHLPASILAGDRVFAGFDLALIGFAALHAWLAIRTARHEPHAARRRPAGRRESPPRPRAHAQGGAGAGDAA
ncbi:MAG: PepSY-associated TM helix domain-containing protein, partial [Pollutimonas bauzanensis]